MSSVSLVSDIQQPMRKLKPVPAGLSSEINPGKTPSQSPIFSKSIGEDGKLQRISARPLMANMAKLTYSRNASILNAPTPGKIDLIA